jgi:hypothetical protein
MAEITTLMGDCLSVLDTLSEDRFNLIYLDPPFFTQKEHALITRDGSATFSFRDLWNSHREWTPFSSRRSAESPYSFGCVPSELVPKESIAIRS